MASHHLPSGRCWLATRLRLLLGALLLATAPAGAAPQEAEAPPASAGAGANISVFDQLFGVDPASERTGKASDGLALPALIVAGKRVSDALAMRDLGASGQKCFVLDAFLDALELAHSTAGDGSIAITLPQPERQIRIAASVLLPGPGGACLPMADLPRHLPMRLAYDAVAQSLALTTDTALPVLMRLERAERQARLHPDAARAAFPLLPPPAARFALWSADVALALNSQAGTHDAGANVLASGALFGLAARAGLSAANRGVPSFGLTLSEARDTPDLLGPLHARSLQLGDVASPAQPLIAQGLSGRGLVISSRPGWRADLVDEITLSGPLPPGWEAELWNEGRLVAVTRDADASGNFRFAGVPLRLGDNVWQVRLFGPHGEATTQDFNRLIGTEMNAENEIDYAIGFVDGGTPFIVGQATALPTGMAGFATIGWGVSRALTARIDVRATASDNPALALGLNGTLAGGLFAATLARDASGAPAGAARLARRVGSTDLILDLASNGRAAGPSVPALSRQFSSLAALKARGQLALGRYSLPWQIALQAGDLRAGGTASDLAARLAVPMGRWQASAALGLSQRAGTLQGMASVAASASLGRWRLRAGIDAAKAASWQLSGTSLSATRSSSRGSLGIDVDWQASSGRIGAGVSLNRRLGPFNLAASAGQGASGWRAGLGLSVGLFNAGNRWQTAPTGLARSGAVLADLFMDDDGDGRHDRGEAAVAGGRLIVDNSLRGDATNEDGLLLIGGLLPGPALNVETQLSSLPDFSLRPGRAGDRLSLRPGEVRRLPIPLNPTGSIQAQVLLVAGDMRTPRSGVAVVLRDASGRETARAVTDFEGYVLFEGLAFGTWTVAVGEQASIGLALSRTEPDRQTSILISPQGG